MTLAASGKMDAPPPDMDKNEWTLLRNSYSTNIMNLNTMFRQRTYYYLVEGGFTSPLNIL